jgi:hypothetical protein
MIYIPRIEHLFPVLRLQADRARPEDFSHCKRPFPSVDSRSSHKVRVY